MNRISEISRNTAETRIQAVLNLDGAGQGEIATGIGFFDHMLRAFAKHGFFDLKLTCDGDLEVDGHHTVEDCGIVLGTAIREALGDKAGIRRYGFFLLPMDEALVSCAVDLSGRPYFVSDASFLSPAVGTFDTQLVNEFFYSVSYAAGMNLHFVCKRGSNDHHIIEAMFKAFAKALDAAVTIDPRVQGVLSTKGSL